jgi:Protein of unknown function DUF262./Protein of unknown function (DUF1524).
MNISQTDYDDSTFDLIDGQQRITTLSVMALEMKKHYAQWENFCGRIDFYGREEDKAFLIDGLPKENTNNNLLNAKSVIESFLNGKDTNVKAAFALYVYNYASFFLSVIPQDYTIIEKNKQFVRMNNRGKQLELVDILKVKLSSIEGLDENEFLEKWNNISQMNCVEKSDENNQQSKLRPTILDIIKRYESVNKPKPNEINYNSIVSFDEFLLIALERLKGCAISYDREKILKTFGFEGDGENKIVWNKDYVNEFMGILEVQFDLFCKYFIRRDKEEKYKWQDVKNGQDKNNQDNERNNNEWNMLRQFQSYLYVSREPHQWMKDAFVWLDNNIFDPSVFLEELKRVDNEYAKKLLKEGRTYHEKFPNINRYWFWRLDYYLWEKSLHKGSKNGANENDKNSGTIGVFDLKEEEKNVVEKYVFSSNRSVEHLHPQNESVEGSWGDGGAVNSFGNLAMISQTLNSYQSNKSIQEKFGKIEKSIADNKSVESLKLYWMYLAYKKGNKWTKEMASKHCEEMCNLLNEPFKSKSEQIG